MPVPKDKLRLGGMALRNGLLVHGPGHWAAAVRTDAGEIKVASGPKPRFKIFDDPDCIGRCTCSHTASTSAMAAMTRSEKSFGCGLVNRMRRMPSTFPSARSRPAKSLVPS